MAYKITAIVFWFIGLVLLVIFLWVFSNTSIYEVKAVDVSGINSKQIVPGFAPIENAEEISTLAFTGKEYDFIMIGMEDMRRKTITCLGLVDDKYYLTEEKVDLDKKMFQEAKYFKVDEKNQKFLITYGIDYVATIFFSLFPVVFFGSFGFLFFIIKKI